jgi:predicted dienelactone hydrolase
MQSPWINRREFSLWASSALVGASAVTSNVAYALPAPQDEVWTDTARSRSLEVLTRWPESKPWGVMIYSHGLGGKRTGGDDWGKVWAADGLVVVHLQHPGSDAASLKAGLGAVKKAMSAEQAVARLQDVKFAIAEINRRKAAAGSPWNAVPVDKMALGGHSFGALTTMILGGMQRNGLSNVADGQVKAFVALSPSLGKDTSLQQARKNLAACTRPFLAITGSLDGEIMNNGETPESRRMVYEALPAGKKAMLWLNEADHLTFAGNDKRIPSTWLVRRSEVTLKEEDRHHELVAKISTAWLREQLLGISMSAPAGLSAQDQWLRG